MGFKSGRACDPALGTFTDKKINGLIGLVAGWQDASGGALQGLRSLAGWGKPSSRSQSPQSIPQHSSSQPCILLHWPCSQQRQAGRVRRRELPKAGDDVLELGRQPCPCRTCLVQVAVFSKDAQNTSAVNTHGTGNALKMRVCCNIQAG